MKNKKYVAGQIMVMFKAEVTEERATEIVEARGWRKINWAAFINLMLVAVPVGEEEKCIIEIQEEPLVKSASLNSIMKIMD